MWIRINTAYMHEITSTKKLWNIYGENSRIDESQRGLALAWLPLVKQGVRKCELAGSYPQIIYFSQNFEPILKTNKDTGFIRLLKNKKKAWCM